ncbi:MAG: DUF1778 domain-containing protein, partial [Xanthomonadales bacterium]|nr:DUF1778 domain-containing protein [Xanthomonadales bacterium]
ALPEQRDLIDKAATLLGRNRSEFMLEVSCDRAREVLLDQVMFNLDERQFEAFERVLHEPPKLSDGLRKLLAVRPTWEVD